jgi:hypothetical protein
MGWSLDELDGTTFVLGLPARDRTTFWVKAVCDGYPGQPPAWHWYNPATGLLDQKADTPAHVGFFHSNGVICAPWNRLAYTAVDTRGPHTDWNIGDWRANPKTGACRTLGAMALRIAQELQSRLQGRMAA